MMISILFLWCSFIHASSFIAVEGEETLQEEGDCDKQYSPCSTFKFPLSLMGFEEDILTHDTQPEWPFRQGYMDDLEFWKVPHNPKMWIKNSCVWFSQVLTQKLGIKKFQQYISRFDYGNEDLSGGLKRAWLMSSLKISPREQVSFLQKFLKRALGLKENTYAMTKNILYVGELAEGWKLYGKTGTGHQWNASQTTQNPKLHQGWFVGWIEKNKRRIVFAKLLLDKKEIKDGELSGGPRAREEAKKKLLKIIAT